MHVAARVNIVPRFIPHSILEKLLRRLQVGHVNLYRPPANPHNPRASQQGGRRLGRPAEEFGEGAPGRPRPSVSQAAQPARVWSRTCGTCCQPSEGRRGLASRCPSAAPAPAAGLKGCAVLLSPRAEEGWEPPHRISADASPDRRSSAAAPADSLRARTALLPRSRVVGVDTAAGRERTRRRGRRASLPAGRGGFGVVSPARIPLVTVILADFI